MSSRCPDCGMVCRAWTLEASLDRISGEQIERVFTHVAISECCGVPMDVEDTGFTDDANEIRWLDGRETHRAGEVATKRWRDRWPRVLGLRRCRDAAALRWAQTARLPYLVIARKFEAARRRAVELLIAMHDHDRIDFISHCELLVQMDGASITLRHYGWRVVALGAQVETGKSAAQLDEAIRNAAQIHGLFAVSDRAGEEGAEPGAGGVLGYPPAPGDAEGGAP